MKSIFTVWYQYFYLKKFGFLHTEPDNKNIYDHIWRSAALLWRVAQSWRHCKLKTEERVHSDNQSINEQ